MSRVIGSELEEGKVKKKISPIIWIFLGIFIGLVLLIGFFVVKDLHQEDILRGEIEEYLEKDITTDEFVVEIQTTGDYAIVEREIKSYFKELAETVQRIDFLEEDEEFFDILTPENFRVDGPEFVETTKKINNVRVEVNETLQKLSEMCTEEYIMSLIERRNLDSYYVDLYRDFMYSEEDLSEIQQIHDEIVTVREQFDTFLGDCDEIISFLKKNAGEWVIENDSIVFRTDELLAEYQKLISKLLEDGEFDSSWNL